MSNVRHCQRCRTFSETDLCKFCSNPRRDPSLLCIVETPADVLAIEQTSTYRGLYFVLLGHLSPLDGIGPDDIGMNDLAARFQTNEIKEIILATNPTVEGEATAHYITELAKTHPIKVTRITYGVPLGSELEFVDSGTLARAVMSRDEVKAT